MVLYRYNKTKGNHMTAASTFETKDFIRAAAAAEKEIASQGYSIKEKVIGNGLSEFTLMSVKKGNVRPTPVKDANGNEISTIYNECPLNHYTAFIYQYFLSRIHNGI